jgi:phage host-nuclease inhibitor protein Gam
MFYLLYVLLWTSNFVLCDDKNIEIQELKGIVARMEETMELQGNAISKYHQQMEEANEKMNHLTEQVSAFQKGNRGNLIYIPFK